MSDPRRVIVAGVGGVGSWLADTFGRVLNVHAPGSQLILVDGDNFEPKNAERQNFSHYGNKAKSVQMDLAPKLDRIMVIPKAAWVVSQEAADAAGEDEEGVQYVSAEDLLQDGDIVFTCFDNMMARKLIFDAAVRFDNIDIFNGGNEDTGFGSTYYYSRRNGLDVTRHPGEIHDEFVNPPDKNPGELSCAERAKLESGTQLIATNMMVAAVLTHDAHQALFADDATEDPSRGYHRAGVILSHEKMWNTDISSFVAYAHIEEGMKQELCDVNTDVAEQIHGYVVKLDSVTVS
ncbi:MAG: ThiF family adenylyltransferase [bacterium]